MDLHTRWGPDPHARGNFEGNDVRIFSHANACYRSSRVSHEKSLLWCGLSSKFFVHLLLLLLLLLLLHIRIIIIVVPSSIKFVNSSRDSTVNLYAWNVTSVSAAEWQCAVLWEWRVSSDHVTCRCVRHVRLTSTFALWDRTLLIADDIVAIDVDNTRCFWTSPALHQFTAPPSDLKHTAANIPRSVTLTRPEVTRP